MSGHLEQIICPECESIETAEVQHTTPFWAYVHICSKCGHAIIESEWEKAAMTEELNLEEIEERCAAGREMVSNLCKRRGEAGSREWVMSIPARPDYDPDLVIAASLDDVPALCREVRRLRDWKAQAENLDGCLSELKRLQEALETERENRGLDNDTWAAENAALRDWQQRAAELLRSIHSTGCGDHAEYAAFAQLLSELEGGK